MFFDEIIHFLLSLTAGIAVGYLTGNYYAVLFAILFGFFIDLVDHSIDYLIYTKGKKFNINYFLSGKYFDDSGKVYLIFHGFEYAIILFILALVFKEFAWIFLSIGVSLFLHLVYDTISNKPVWPTYFILYRACHGFNHKDFKFPKCKDLK